LKVFCKYICLCLSQVKAWSVCLFVSHLISQSSCLKKNIVNHLLSCVKIKEKFTIKNKKSNDLTISMRNFDKIQKKFVLLLYLQKTFNIMQDWEMRWLTNKHTDHALTWDRHKQTHRSWLDLGQTQTNTHKMAWLGTGTNKHTDHGLTWDRHKQTHRSWLDLGQTQTNTQIMAW
jgi:hypothetical protein